LRIGKALGNRNNPLKVARRSGRASSEIERGHACCTGQTKSSGPLQRLRIFLKQSSHTGYSRDEDMLG